MCLPSGTQQPRNEKLSADDEDQLISVLVSPESAIPIVIGGDGGAWSAVIPPWSLGTRSKVVTQSITTNG